MGRSNNVACAGRHRALEKTLPTLVPSRSTGMSTSAMRKSSSGARESVGWLRKTENSAPDSAPPLIAACDSTVASFIVRPSTT